MRTLIIPDLHHHTEEADGIIARFSADQVIFLGDYFDNFGDSPEIAGRTAQWLRGSLSQPGRIHLLGNHDLSYAFPKNATLYCPGFSPEKSSAVSNFLRAEHWTQLQLVHFEGAFALSHAGLSPSLFETPREGFDPSAIERRCAEAIENARGNIFDPVLSSGLGFGDPAAGITWLRWGVLPVSPPLCQIVGHTPDQELRIERLGECFNVCLDTFGHWVGLIEDGQFFAVELAGGQRERIGGT